MSIYGKRRTFKKNRNSYKYGKRYSGSFKKRRMVRRIKRTGRINRMLSTVAERKHCYMDLPNGQVSGINIVCNDNVTPVLGIFNSVATLVTQGTTRVTRVGNSIFLRYLVIKGYFENEITASSSTNQSETGQMCFWLFKERMPGKVTGQKRLALVSDWEDQLPDYPSLGYTVCAKKTKFMQGMGVTAINNTIAQPWGNMWRFKIKIPIFKKMEFLSGGAWLINGKFLEYVPVPFVDLQNYNRTNNGVYFAGNAKVTFTDV